MQQNSNYRVQTNYPGEVKKLLDGEPVDVQQPTKRRAESLATRGEIDFMALINEAKKKCRMPIKLSF